jgi:hypothetical protein
MDEEIEKKTALLNEPSDSLTSNFGENTPDGVLEKIGMSKKFKKKFSTIFKGTGTGLFYTYSYLLV